MHLEAETEAWRGQRRLSPPTEARADDCWDDTLLSCMTGLRRRASFTTVTGLGEGQTGRNSSATVHAACRTHLERKSRHVHRERFAGQTSSADRDASLILSPSTVIMMLCFN